METPTRKEEFSTFYEREVDSLFRYVTLRVSSRDEAMDIVQETFCSLWEKFSLGETITNMRAFLYASVRNRIIDWYRKKKPLSLEQIPRKDGSDEDDDLPFDPIDMLAESTIVYSAEAREVLEIISKLPLSYREAVYLRVVEEFMPSEIAETLGISAGATSVRITRGLALIRKELGLVEKEENL